jgi:lysophospholipase L1-like esterase
MRPRKATGSSAIPRGRSPAACPINSTLRGSFPGVRFDYVNAGVPGYTVSSILKNLTDRVAPLEPDVIVFYEGSNNLTGEMRDLAAKQGLVDDAQFHEVSWPGRYSLLWYLTEKNLRVLTAGRSAERGERPPEVDVRTLGGEYRDGLVQIIATAKQHAKVVAVATFSTQLRPGQTAEQQMRASSSAHFYMPFASPATLMEAYTQYNRIAREVATEAGVLLIEGEDQIPGDAAHFADTVHFTDLGSRAMAARVTRALASSAQFAALLPAASAQR